MSILTSVADINRFALAGNATLTLTSVKTGTSFTYRIRKSEDGAVWFVSVLTGPNNEADFQYLGIVRPAVAGLTFRRTAKSKIGEDAPSHKAFVYFWQKVITQSDLPDSLEVRHEGRCGRCNRKLTVPESIDNGIGPECAAQMGF